MKFLLNGINNIKVKEIDIVYSNKKSVTIFCSYRDDIKNKKEEIDELENNEIWDKMKKIGNPYELIYTTYNKKRKNDSISNYIPISRSYFKLWEIFFNFNLFEKNKNKFYSFSHLAEGPGGFMEATYNYMNYIDRKGNTYYGITLKPNNEHIPDWNKIKKIFNDDKNIFINYGNLYEIEDVKKYIKNFSVKKADLVTADGGFDYSNDFNGQEINSCKIIYSEIAIALNILEKNGAFIIKIFDIFTLNMIQLIKILNVNFEKVYIYKPETSRPANSEKYIVCINYLNILDNEDKNNLLNMIEKWNNFELDDNSYALFKNIKIDNEYIYNLDKFNKDYLINQKFYLDKTINLIKNKPCKSDYYEIIKDQVNIAINWCEKYNIKVNKNSIYYKKNFESEI